MKKDFLPSLWENVTLPKFDKLSHNQEIDICVIGGGISGLTAAYKLAKSGKRVLVLDAATLGSGQTSRTTGHLSFQLETEFYKLKDLFSCEELSQYINAHKRGIDVIKEIIDEEQISCDFEFLEGFLFSNNMEDIPELYKEQDAAAECGLKLQMKATPFLKESKLGLVFPRQAQFHPLKYLAGLIDSLKRNNAIFHENTRVVKVEEKNGGAEVTTSEGYIVKCQYAIVATDTPINDRFKIHTKQHAYRTYTMAFKMNKNLTPALIWDTADPYHYIRTVGDMLLVGGEDHKTGQNPEHDPFDKLETWARENLANLGEVAAHWSGQVFEPVDQMAYVGRNSLTEPHVMIITGESGIGLTTASFASEIIRDLILLGHHPQEKLFDPGRITFKSAGDYAVENINTVSQYKDWITLSKGADRQLPKKCRACPHLGGLTHWNEKEHTWDCPAHGSRFNELGQVIEGPAHEDLDKA